MMNRSGESIFEIEKTEIGLLAFLDRADVFFQLSATAPSRVAISRTFSAVIEVGSPVWTLCSKEANLREAIMFWLLLLAGPSVARPTVIPWLSMAGTGATPEDKYMLLTGL